jgi:hypothetical protein
MPATAIITAESRASDPNTNMTVKTIVAIMLTNYGAWSVSLL